VRGFGYPYRARGRERAAAGDPAMLPRLPELVSNGAMGTLTELPIWRGVQIAASVVGVVASTTAIVRAFAGVPVGRTVTQGLGWLAVIYAAGFAVAVLVATWRVRARWWLIPVGLIAFVFCAVGSFGLLISRSETGSIVIGGFCLGVVLLWGVIGLVSFVSASARGVQECPDCAEKIKAKARVCRYCGYRFQVPIRGDVAGTGSAWRETPSA
jgi:hypothetical protein